MKRQIRLGVFETNSSSVHSLIMCDKDTYERWKNGELLLAVWDGEFCGVDDFKMDASCKEFRWFVEDMIEKNKYEFFKTLPEDVKKKMFVEWLTYDGDLQTYEQYDEMGYYEQFEQTYKTKSGEEVIGFGFYGHD